MQISNINANELDKNNLTKEEIKEVYQTEISDEEIEIISEGINQLANIIFTHYYQTKGKIN